MQFSVVLVALFTSATMAAPTTETETSVYIPCSGLYSSVQCCATSVLDLADLTCRPPPKVPTSAANFGKICADIGQRARCCVLPALGLGVLCQTPAGVTY
ncbi:fungal hydrophobin [Colletotrichum graminicola]|uniref:Fungal hydrophobin n=1 Tax=Colletotrichum graminicola (strain M1.001 / M2 / FGSC 10212) TaxID=645133 RepID=E3QVP2_COLGM|nr:fungal hydrophobin [Colletotrichum graminicola M1.001]EFQ34930.1 fungal hydrophobin [Colletotrichum graminicola M1.001]WDK12862.1 fungal hydrophobin [Colletotrichum graminicola]